MKRKLTLEEQKHLNNLNCQHTSAWYLSASMFWRETLTFQDKAINVKSLVRTVIGLVRHNRLNPKISN